MAVRYVLAQLERVEVAASGALREHPSTAEPALWASNLGHHCRIAALELLSVWASGVIGVGHAAVAGLDQRWLLAAPGAKGGGSATQTGLVGLV